MRPKAPERAVPREVLWTSAPALSAAAEPPATATEATTAPATAQRPSRKRRIQVSAKPVARRCARARGPRAAADSSERHKVGETPPQPPRQSSAADQGGVVSVQENELPIGAPAKPVLMTTVGSDVGA